MARFAAFQFPAANSEFQRVQKPLTEPEPGFVRIKVHACGLCHGDAVAKFGAMGATYPRTPGHEVAGLIDSVGEGVTTWKVGDRAALGWYGKICDNCRVCADGEDILCEKLSVTGTHADGGYAQYVYAPAAAAIPIPDSLSFKDAAPLVCAGVTVYNALRRINPPKGSIVGVEGLGGLGHLGLQFASKMGYRVFAFSRGKGKEEESLKLGAEKYFDTTAPDFIDQVKALGGVDVLLETASSSAAATKSLPVLAPRGTLVILGVGHEPIQVDPVFMVAGRRSIVGSASGTATDSADTLKFAAENGVRPVNEIFPFERTPEAFERMMTGRAIFRVVVDFGLDK